MVKIGAPDFPIDKIFPFLAVFAVANTALINMLMASRLIYGMAHQDVLPRPWARCSRAVARRGPAIALHHAAGARPDLRRHARLEIVGRGDLSGTTALLLLGVFTVVNIACLILRRSGTATARCSYLARAATPLVAALLCAFLAGPWVGRNNVQYQIAGGLLASAWCCGAHLDDQQEAQHREGKPVGIQIGAGRPGTPPPRH